MFILPGTSANGGEELAIGLRNHFLRQPEAPEPVDDVDETNGEASGRDDPWCVRLVCVLCLRNVQREPPQDKLVGEVSHRC